jgi:hypothetical protein
MLLLRLSLRILLCEKNIKYQKKTIIGHYVNDANMSYAHIMAIMGSR